MPAGRQAGVGGVEVTFGALCFLLQRPVLGGQVIGTPGQDTIFGVSLATAGYASQCYAQEAT